MKIWAHSANIPASCLWIGTPQAYVWTSWNFPFLMGGSYFEVKIHTANWQKCCGKKIINQFLYTKGNQIRFCPIYFWIPTDFTIAYSIWCIYLKYKSIYPLFDCICPWYEWLCPQCDIIVINMTIGFFFFLIRLYLSLI